MDPGAVIAFAALITCVAWAVLRAVYDQGVDDGRRLQRELDNTRSSSR